MHPPAFHIGQRLSDWPDCTMEIRCPCGRSSHPAVQLVIREHGDRTFRDLIPRLRCQGCRAEPAEVYLVAGYHRRCVGGPDSNDWAVALV